MNIQENRPFIWQMIKEAIEALNGNASYSDIKRYINSKWDNVPDNTINAQIAVVTVNRPARVHYPENKKPRLSTGRYDLLFFTGRGQVVKYNPEEHGVWEIYEQESGALAIRQVLNEELDTTGTVEEVTDSYLFAIEAHLRDFLILNLYTVKDTRLTLYVDETGRDGKEYPTTVGPIDILTNDTEGNFFVFELKLSKGADKALGQLLRYMGWVKRHLAGDKEVKGIIVANKMDQKIKYAQAVIPGVTLYEYEMKFELSKPKDLL